MTDEELIARLRDVYVGNMIRLTAADRIDELMRDLKSVLAREAETQVRHDNKIDALEAKLAKALAMLASIGNTQTSGGGQASVMAFHAREALAEIKGEAE
jgi:hypothetical protein